MIARYEVTKFDKSWYVRNTVTGLYISDGFRNRDDAEKHMRLLVENANERKAS